MKPWTKTALRALTQQIDMFVLSNRLYVPTDAIRRDVEARRLEITLSGLRGFAAMLSERAESSRGTARHAEANPHIWGDSTPEMIERFSVLAKGEQKDADKCAALVARLEAVGLPAEVATYFPGGAP